jgi:hypothetical protein
MRFVIRLLSTLLLFSPVLPASAAPAEKESTYEVEVLVFENRFPDLVGEELLARDAATTRQRALDTAAPPETAASEPYLRPAISNLLERDGHYRILAHAHWMQTLDPAGKAAVKPVRIVSARPDELEGTVQFYMSRYLHLDVNLLFRDEEAMKSGVVYRIGEQRRVKSQETQYFDHPRFGVLVRVMPAEKGAKDEGRGTR